jgi:putative ABC transport system permease protein
MQGAALQRTMKELDPGLALTRIATGDALVSTSLATPRYLTVLVGMFALTALVLSVVGVYGVMAYFVQQHTRDLGIRLALGGEPAAIRRMIVFQGVKLVAIGVVVGVAAALLTAQLMQSLLFGVSATDLTTLAGVPAMLVLVAVIACALPARRAAKVNPVEILREA